LFLVALVLGYLRAVSGSLLPCLGLHVAFNMVGVLLLVTGVSTPTTALPIPIAVQVGGWVAAFALTYALHRLGQSSPEAAEARREDQR
jgi:hypothetical protein